MPLNSDDWEDCSIESSDILLDKENPRIPESQRKSQDRIRIHLVKNEGVLQLASKIADYSGIFHHERIILIKEQGKYIVVEGNRRVCAANILLRPWLAGDDDAMKKVPQINEPTRKNISKLGCCIAKNRKSADEVIAKIHLQELREHWNEIRQIRFVSSRISLGRNIEDIAEEIELSETDVLERVRWEKIINILRGLRWTDDEKKIIWDDYIKISPFMRIVDSNDCHEHFGFKIFTDFGKVNTTSIDAYDVIKQICIDSIISQKMETLRTVDHTSKIKGYLKKAFPIQSANEPSTPDLLGGEMPVNTAHLSNTTTNHPDHSDLTPPNTSQVEPITSNVSDQPNTAEEIQPHRLKPKPCFFDDLICIHKNNQRLMQLIRELRVIWKSLDNMRYSASFLLRATFEEALYHYLSSKGLIKKDAEYSASQLLKRAHGLGANCFSQKRLNKKITTILDRNHLENLNCNAHNDSGNHSPRRLSEIAGDMKPILKFICMESDNL